MADAKNIIIDAKKDLYWALAFLFILALLWYFSGGPSRDTSKAGPFITSQNEQRAEGLNETIQIAKAGYLSVGSDAKKSDPQQEYIEIRISSSNKNPLLLTGLVLKNKNNEQVVIGKGAKTPYINYINQQEDIYLQPGETAIISTGQSPIGNNFLINKCSGYLSQMQEFFPKLKIECPDPIKDELLPAMLDNACLDYIKKEFEKCKTKITFPYGVSTNCQSYINERINYNSCVNWHKKDSDFYKKEWRVYLGKNSEFWNNSHDIVTLSDSEGKIIDWRSY